jgi:hypothetical protein
MPEMRVRTLHDIQTLDLFAPGGFVYVQSVDHLVAVPILLLLFVSLKLRRMVILSS